MDGSFRERVESGLVFILADRNFLLKPGVRIGWEGNGKKKWNGAPHRFTPKINPLKPKSNHSATRLHFRSVVPPLAIPFHSLHSVLL